MRIDDLVKKLKGVKKSQGGFIAKCPTHKDNKPSLNIHVSDGKVLLHCFAGCPTARVVEALGMEWRDLFDDKPHPRPGLSRFLRMA